ncbi:hypothetical protein MOMMJLID_CDS0043 [Arthrobacter phage 1191A]|nr:hypothetical protein MOMMJLID_CDS0043 [Arthrobacter phage 1191A]
MTIQEILEDHLRVKGVRGLETLCICGWHTAQRLRPEDLHRSHLAEVLEKHMLEREAQLRQLVRDMTDPGACWFDHHGGCQEHGHLDLKPGELCPHTEAKQLLGDEPNGR